MHTSSDLPLPTLPTSPAAAKPVNTPKPRVVNKCEDLPPRSTAAFDWLQQANQAQPFSDFMWGVRRFRLMGACRRHGLCIPARSRPRHRSLLAWPHVPARERPKHPCRLPVTTAGLLREVSKGKALILPSNAAFQVRWQACTPRGRTRHGRRSRAPQLGPGPTAR